MITQQGSEQPPQPFTQHDTGKKTCHFLKDVLYINILPTDIRYDVYAMHLCTIINSIITSLSFRIDIIYRLFLNNSIAYIL